MSGFRTFAADIVSIYLHNWHLLGWEIPDLQQVWTRLQNSKWYMTQLIQVIQVGKKEKA